MKPRAAERRRQRGAALMVVAALLILGVSWFALAAVNRSPVQSLERDVITAQSLRAAKQALLAYIAQDAARTSNGSPGRLPCPELLTSIGTASEGDAAAACSNATEVIGRLPWRTLGLDKPLDGAGEVLWYVISPGFQGATPINFGTPGQLTYNGAANAAVAVIIAPGKALNTTIDPAALPGWCPAKVNQHVATRLTPPLAAANFLECGNATASYRDPGTSQWTNDHAIVITAAEWADAIAPGVNDRLQRQVAPAMEDFRTTTAVTRWGQSFLPNASTLVSAGQEPENNNLCGNWGVWSGMPPTATVASGLCNTNWSSWSSWGVDLGVSLNFGGCAPQPTYLRCTYTVLLGGVAPSPWIVATAPRIGYSFRRFDPATIVVIRNGTPVINAVRNYSASVSSADGSATIQFEIQFPLLSLIDTLEVRVPYADDALLADARSAWYVNNGWDRYTYYGVARAASSDPGFNTCPPTCLTVNGMPAPTNDKRLVLVLMGRPLPGTTQPSVILSNYWERQNQSVGVIYEVGAADAAFNDRVAACPFRYQNALGADVVLCN